MGIFTCWTELLVTQDSVQYAETCTKLANAGIAYKERIQHIGHGDRRSGLMASFGENARYANMYQIYVKKKELEDAQGIVFRK